MIFVILPTYNEEKTIGLLCDALREVMLENKILYTIIAVNDGSIDQTEKLLRKYKKKMQIEIITHKKNRGLSETIKTGLFYALKKSKVRDIIITMDADNTHAPGLILRMLRMIKEGNDVIIASRYHPDSRVKGVPLYRRVLSLGVSILCCLLFPIKGVKDYTCGYRAYKAEILQKALSFYGDSFVSQPGFSCMLDILLKLRKFDVIVTEVPIILRYDLKQGMSKMRVWETVKETTVLIFKRRLEM